ncbi:MAG: hypothetical protein LIO92_02880, partial [Clostridiales bacterium]|nr:hypothetical protein [Clostridiales bacterium]
MKLRRRLAALLICALVAGSMPTVSFAAPSEEGVESEYSEDEDEAVDDVGSEEADTGDDKGSEESDEAADSEGAENSESGEAADSEESEDSEEDAAEDAGKSDEAEDPEEAEESAGTEDAEDSDEAAETEDSEGSKDGAETKESDSTEEGEASEDTAVMDEASGTEESAEEEETSGTEESSEAEEETSDTVDETDDSADGELEGDVTEFSTETAGEKLENVLEEELTVGITTASLTIEEAVEEVEDLITDEQIEQLEELIDKGLALVEEDDSLTELADCIAEAEELIKNEAATSEEAEKLIEQLEELIDDAYANVTLVVEEDTYVLMNIPYAEFYAEEADEGVDAYTSATYSKPRGTLAAGSYHADESGEAILGVVYPVKLTDGLTVASLSDCEYTEVTDDDYLSITVKNRGKEVTTDYNGSEVLFERPSYSYYVLDEEPDYYKEVSMNADGELVFGVAEGTVTTVTDASLTYSDTDRHVDHALTVSNFDTIADDTVYGVVIHSATGSYGLRHITNIWRVYYLGWDEGDLDGYYDSLVGDYVTSITYYTSSGIYELELDKGVYVGTGGYVLMNIPYAEFYVEEADEGVDAYTSATYSKPRGTLAAGSYHEDESGEAINGIIYPVKLTGDLTLASLSDCIQITDDSSVTITVTNRGKEVTTTYEGSDALFESPSYSYYILSETPSYYKELSVDEDGNWTFGAAQGTVTTVTDATLTYSDTDRHVDHALTVGDFDMIADDTVYGVVLHTATGNYGLRHITNIWRVYYLGWDEGDLDGYYDSLVGDYVTS